MGVGGRGKATSRLLLKKSATKAEVKSDLWENGGRTINTPQPLVTDDWTLPAENVIQPRDGPRKRARALKRPNQRPAVAVPLEGTSFNPTLNAHQEALAKAVRKLEKQKESHQKFAKWLSLGRDGGAVVEEGGMGDKSKFGGGLQIDHVRQKAVLEDESASSADGSSDSEHGEKAGQRATGKERKTAKKSSKKKPKLEIRKETNKTRVNRRHPDRSQVAAEIDDIDELLKEQEKQTQRKIERLARRHLARSEGLQTKKIGRHIHHPLPVEVQPTKDLVGALRHVKSGIVHPVQERIKSLEERNLIPARMRHTYNKRKILKPKGDVLIKREAFGPILDAHAKV
jgi:hypothetical protein